MTDFEQGVKIRRKIKSGFKIPERLCFMELAEQAVNTEYSGFEDPRSAASEALALNCGTRVGKGANCERPNCDVIVKVDMLQDTYESVGNCAIADLCIKEAWDAKDYGTVFDEGITHVSSESRGETCPHLNCTFSCGSSIDGNLGTAGICVKENGEIATDLPVVDLEIS